MGMMRRLLQDRVSGSAIAVLVACLLLIQGLLAGTAQGAVAATAADPFHVICSMSGFDPLDHAGRDTAPLKKGPECPCATLCRLAATAVPAILVEQSGFLHVAVETAFDSVFPKALASAPVLRGVIAQPRGPPLPA
ncbi:hypothetical protein ASC97_17030 [Rhizobium sp. Root1203]|nr:hypothetical protein ASC97_17030 [Rhizobium sp. Root1203]